MLFQNNIDADPSEATAYTEVADEALPNQTSAREAVVNAANGDIEAADDGQESPESLVPVITDFNAAREVTTAAGLLLSAEAADKREGLTASSTSPTLKGLATGRSDEFAINPYLIQVKPGWNGRNMDLPENIKHVDTLAKSIAAIGVKATMTVTMEDGIPYLTDGHCRLLAVFRAINVYGAEIKSVPVKSEGRYSSDADQVLSQIVRNAGKGLSPMEKGAIFARLLAFGWTEKQISEKTGESRGNLKALLELQAAPARLRKLLDSGKVKPTLAMEIIKKEGLNNTAVDTLERAWETAKAEGKDKATARHVTALPKPAGETAIGSVGSAGTAKAKPVNPLIPLRALLAKIIPTSTPDHMGSVMLKVDAIDFQRLKALAA